MRPVEAAAERVSWSRWIPTLEPRAAALGLQMAVAGTAAFYCAQFLRLQYPSWSVLTVILLVIAQYVGALQEKALLRMVGTIIGGVLGYLATGAWQQSPLLYLATTFVVVAVSIAMFSQSRAPYAFFLTGLTFVVIASNGQADPANSWSFALARTEEVFLGVVASTVVQALIFPRYANKDFFLNLRSCLAELADATPRAAGKFVRGHSGLMESLRDFPTRASALRNLLRFGARESHQFRREIGRHGTEITLVARAANLLRSLAPVPPSPEPYRSSLGPILEEWGRHLGAGWQTLAEGRTLDTAWHTRAGTFVKEVRTRVVALRSDPEARKLGPAHVADVSVMLLTMIELQDCLVRVDQLRSESTAPLPRSESLALAPAWPDRFWIHHGIRAGLATVIALVLQNWLSPPGGTLMVLCVFVFTAMNALSPEGSGDRGAFHYVVLFGAVSGLTCLALFAGTPLLASYAVLNILLVTWLFLLGYWMCDRGGVTVPAQVSLLVLVSILSLNAQVPVPFESVAGTFFGLVSGLLIAAVVQRLLWPVLPQRQLRNGLVAYLRTTAECLEDGFEHLPLWRRTKLALTPSQSRRYLAAMRDNAPGADQADRLEDYVFTLQQLIGEISLCSGRLRPALPPELSPLMLGPLDAVKQTLRAGLIDLADALAAHRPPPDISTRADEVLARWDDALAGLRRTVHERGVAPEVSTPIFGLAARYRTALALLKHANADARRLDLPACLDDVAL